MVHSRVLNAGTTLLVNTRIVHCCHLQHRRNSNFEIGPVTNVYVRQAEKIR